jgi:signal transduction histidine kinase
MKKSVWIFLFAVLLPSVVLGWLALRSAEEQQIVFERRTAELYQKETEALAVTVRDTVEAERRVFGETVRRLLAKGDAAALARDFTGALNGAWLVKAVGFAIDKDGKLVSPSVAMASKQPELQRFLMGNSSFLTSSEPAIVYNWGGDNLARGKFGNNPMKQAASNASNNSVLYSSVSTVAKDARQVGQALALGDSTATNKQAAGGITLATAASESAQKAAVPALQLETPKRDRSEARKETEQPAPALAPASVPPPLPRPAPAKPMDSKTATARKTAMPAAVKSARADDAVPVPDVANAPAGRGGATEFAKAVTRLGADGSPAEKKQAMDKLAGIPASAAVSDAPSDLAKKKMEGAAAGETLRVRRSPNEEKPAAPAALLPLPDAAPAPVPQKAAPVATANEPASVTANLGTLTKTGIGSLTLSSTNVQNRLVEPQQLLGQQSAAVSAVVPETAEFCSITKESEDGMVARFVQDKLNLIFWLRPPEAPETVFGCLVEAGHFTEVWKDVMERHRSSPRGYGSRDSQPEFVLALLDDRGKPVATRPTDTAARDWKHPFVASEIGEMLPHWEAALYLASSTALAESARGLWRTLAFTIAGAVALIAFGGWLVVADARRQLALAQQKTDFVSNVSHELKTPLTSIRMFAELMHDRPQPAEKQGQYLRIITAEAERLTRLINNVLDFAKIGRKQKRFEKKPFDLHAVVARVWESQELHLREAGFTTRWEAAPGPYPVLGDDDALAQVLVNLLSNAEKYSTERKDVELHAWLDDARVNIAVMDRGMGVPNGDDRKIFEAFYRAHDSLNSGIQGSGLGLTLAQRIAHEHGGDIQFERREGGGSRFTLRLPIVEKRDEGITA